MNIELYNENIKKVLEKNKLEELRNKTILVTGASGLIGSAIIDVLNYLNVKENYNIKMIALIRNAKNVPNRIKEYQNVMIWKQDIVEEIQYEEKVDYIIHAASNAHPQAFSTDPVGTMLGNFIGMNNIMKFAVKYNCKRVEYISTGEVYGQAIDNTKTYNEEYSGKIEPMDVRSCYPLSKLASETLCISYSKQYEIETVIARPCHVYGPTQTDKDSRASAQFIRNVLNEEDIVMTSKGSQIRSYCYVLDCVTAILTILLKGESSNAYNISNKNSIVSIKEMAEIIAQKSNKKVIYQIPENVKTYITRAVLDSTKLEKLGWVPCYMFEDGIEQTLKILESNF